MKFILDIIENYFKSFDNTEIGYSRKKLFGWMLIVTAVFIEVFTVVVLKHHELATTYITVNLTTAVSILGINTYQSIKIKKHKDESTNNSNPKN